MVVSSTFFNFMALECGGQAFCKEYVKNESKSLQICKPDVSNKFLIKSINVKLSLLFIKEKVSPFIFHFPIFVYLG